MKVCSFHPSRKAAEEFAEGLKEKGAEGVEVGKKTSAGYPVTSVVLEDRESEVEAMQKSRVPESTEKYDYETGATPAAWNMATFEMKDVKLQKSKDDIIRIAREELRKANLGDVGVKVSAFQGRDPEAPYADATLFKRGKEYKIHIHPIHQYYDDDYTREVVRHEIEHILRKES